MRESKKNACNDSAIIAGVLAFPVSWKILWSWFWYSILHKKYIIPKQNQLSRSFGTENNATFAVEKENKSYTVDIEQKSKINQLLLSATPKGLLFSEWLKRNGYSDQLIKRYRESGWLEMLSKGVMYRTGDSLSAYAALSCYNRQLGKTFRVAAHSALELFGFNHYVPMGKPLLMGGTRQTACSGMDTPRCFRQGDKTVFHRYLFRTADRNDCEIRSGSAGFYT